MVFIWDLFCQIFCITYVRHQFPFEKNNSFFTRPFGDLCEKLPPLWKNNSFLICPLGGTQNYIWPNSKQIPGPFKIVTSTWPIRNSYLANSKLLPGQFKTVTWQIPKNTWPTQNYTWPNSNSYLVHQKLLPVLGQFKNPTWPIQNSYLVNSKL